MNRGHARRPIRNSPEELQFFRAVFCVYTRNDMAQISGETYHSVQQGISHQGDLRCTSNQRISASMQILRWAAHLRGSERAPDTANSMSDAVNSYLRLLNRSDLCEASVVPKSPLRTETESSGHITIQVKPAQTWDDFFHLHGTGKPAIIVILPRRPFVQEERHT